MFSPYHMMEVQKQAVKQMAALDCWSQCTLTTLTTQLLVSRYWSNKGVKMAAKFQNQWVKIQSKGY